MEGGVHQSWQRRRRAASPCVLRCVLVSAGRRQGVVTPGAPLTRKHAGGAGCCEPRRRARGAERALARALRLERHRVLWILCMCVFVFVVKRARGFRRRSWLAGYAQCLTRLHRNRQGCTRWYFVTKLGRGPHLQRRRGKRVAHAAEEAAHALGACQRADATAAGAAAAALLQPDAQRVERLAGGDARHARDGTCGNVRAATGVLWILSKGGEGSGAACWMLRRRRRVPLRPVRPAGAGAPAMKSFVACARATPGAAPGSGWCAKMSSSSPSIALGAAAQLINCSTAAPAPVSARRCARAPRRAAPPAGRRQPLEPA